MRCLAFAIALALPAVASAEPLSDPGARARARALGYAGVEAYAVGDYAAASEKLEEAYRLLAVPSLGYWSGKALIELGRLVEAAERFRAVARLEVNPSDPAVQQSAKVEAVNELVALTARIPTVDVKVTGAAAEEVHVSVDGVAIGSRDLARAQSINPGRHTIVGVRRSERTEILLNISEGARERVWLRFSPTAAPAGAGPEPLPSKASAGGGASLQPALRTGGWIAVAAGGAALTTSLVAYLVGQDLHRGFEQRNGCANDACSKSEVDTYNAWRTVHLTGLIAGAVLGAAGATLVLATQSSSETQGPRRSLALQLAPAAATLRADF